MFIIAKEYRQDFNLLHTIILGIHHLFGEKWLTLSVLSPFIQLTNIMETWINEF